MTKIVNSLAWQDQSDPHQPLAVYLLDFKLDPVWQFSNLLSALHQQAIYPNGVVIDNSANAATINISIGPGTTTVSPYQRTAIDFPQTLGSIAFSCNAAVTLPIEFYMVKPSPNNFMVNYFGPTTSAEEDEMVRSYIAGCTLATTGGISSFTVAPGVCADTTNQAMMALNGTFTKTTALWAAGNGGSLDAGAILPNTWYDVYVIGQTSGATDVLISLANVPSLPANYTMYRRIGSILTDGTSNWIAFIQVGNKFVWSTLRTDKNNFSVGTNVNTVINLPSLPKRVNVEAILSVWYNGGSNGQALIYGGNQPSLVAAPSTYNFDAVTGSPGNGDAGQYRVETDTNQNIQIYNTITGGPSLPWFIAVEGWIDRRGQDA
jgi:hypothetical protein